MKHWTKMSLAIAASAIVFQLAFTGTASARGGGSWGSAGASFGSRGFASGGFRTPVRDFFAYRQPVRSLFRGVGRALTFGGPAWGSAGAGSVGYASVGYGSAGYQYYSSAGFSTTNFASAGYSVAALPASSFGSVGTSTVSYGGSGGFVSAPAVSYPVSSFQQPYCPDCTGSHSSAIHYGSGLRDGSPVFSGDPTLIPSEYYDSNQSVIPSPQTGRDPRGFETPPQPRPAGGEDSTSRFDDQGKAILALDVPYDAKVFVNNRQTKTEGANRKYVSRNLRPGQNYSFAVEAIVTRDGREVSLKKMVTMKAGVITKVDFDFDQPVLTQVTVKVPETATVMLCGNETTAQGSVRNFRTRLLPGKVWNDYDIDVSYEIDGHVVTEKRTINIEAGQKYEVDFRPNGNFYVAK